MNYMDFIRSLFLVAGSIYLVILIYHVFCLARADLRKKDIYKQLQRFTISYFDGNPPRNGESVVQDCLVSVKEFRELLKIQCKTLYDCYVKDDVYLSKCFCSDEDILIKFISTIRPYQKIDLIKHEIEVYKDKGDARQYPVEVKQDNNKISNIIGITGIITTVIGIIATIISLI